MIALNEHGTPQLNTVHHCRAEALLSALDSGSIDLVVTSPPYGLMREYNGFSWNFEYIAQQTHRVLRAGGVLVWIVGDSVEKGSETFDSLKQAIYLKDTVGFNAHQTIFFHDPGTAFPDKTRYTRQVEYCFVFSKGRPRAINLITQRNKWAGDSRPEGSVKRQREKDGSYSIRGRKQVKEYGVMGNLWTMGTGYGISHSDDYALDHPATFPEKLAERHILTWSNAGDVVMDFFNGSGTTPKMARKHGRQYLGCDISLEYVALSDRRLAQPYAVDMFAQVPA